MAVSLAVCILDSCPSWLVKISQEVACDWVKAVVRDGMVPSALKEVVVCPLLKRPSLNPTMLGNFSPVSNLLILGNIVECVVDDQLQRALD